jgi:hypothetical protein
LFDRPPTHRGEVRADECEQIVAVGVCLFAEEVRGLVDAVDGSVVG